MKSSARCALPLAFVFLSMAAQAIAQAPSSSPARRTFVNPIAEGADPWVIRDPNGKRHLWCMSDGNRAIAIHAGESLTNIGQKHVVWKAPEDGPCSREVWAPELHYLDGRYYIYFAASDGRNENHLTYVLQSQTADPLGEYQRLGPLRTGDGPNRDTPNVWAIDMTVLEHRGKRYGIWSGWDAPGTDRQFLYIAAMKSPTELTGPRVRLCPNADHLWERVRPTDNERGLHEGPQVFQQNGETHVIYSCGASWLPTYKLGALKLTGDNPLSPESWSKLPQPVFQSTQETYGVGHSCFVPSPDGAQWWHVFHAKRDSRPGWRRAIFIQPLGSLQVPEMFGDPVAAGQPLTAPAGDPTPRPSTALDQAAYYGHHQFAAIGEQVARLGHVPDHPVNAYRCGEKLVWRAQAPTNLTATVSIDFHGDNRARDAGLLFRCNHPAVGYDAQQGYFAGLIPQTGLVILGKMDGKRWHELSRAKADIDARRPQRLSVSLQGANISVSHNGKPAIQFMDAQYTDGSLGLRVVDTDATFRDFELHTP